ncbi:NOD3 protein, partial [Thecamonas trahens ATCC 50062]
MSSGGAAPDKGKGEAGASSAGDKSVLEQGVALAKANPAAAAATGAVASGFLVAAGRAAFRRLKRYSARKRNQIDRIEQAYRLYINEDFNAVKQFKFKRQYVPSYAVSRVSFSSDAYRARLSRKLPVFDSLLRTICSYQAARARRKTRKGKLSDPTHLFLDELKDWIVAFSSSPMDTEASLQEAEARRDYVEHVIFSGFFYPSKHFNWTTETFEQTVLQVLAILNDTLIPLIRNGIADLSVSYQLSELSDKVNMLINESAKYCMRVFADTDDLSRTLDVLYRDVDNLNSQYKTAITLTVRELLTSPDARVALERADDVRSLTEDEYMRQGHPLPANFFVDHRGASIVPPGVFLRYKAAVPSVDTSPRYFFDQIEQASGVASGVLPLFLRDPLVMETFVSLLGRLQHLAACKDLFAQAVQVANTGGNLSICGHREVNTHLGYLLRIVSALVAEIRSAVGRINLAADEAICNIVSAPYEEGRKADLVKSIAKSRRNSYKEHYKAVLTSRQQIETLVKEALATVSPILQELDKASVGDLVAEASEAVDKFTSHVSRLLGDAKDTSAASASRASASNTVAITKNDDVATAAAAAAAAPAAPSAPAVVAATSSSAPGLIPSDDLASAPVDTDTLVRHIELRHLKLDDELSRQMCELQLIPHRASVVDVDVSKCTISPGATANLCDVFANCPNLHRLRFWNAHLGDEGAAAVAGLLFREARMAPRLASLRSVDLNENNLGPDAAFAIADALKAGARIKWLDLGYNHIGDSGAAALAQALHHQHHLQGLVLQNNDIADAGAAVLANMLMSNVALRHLGLQANAISDLGALTLADALDLNRTVTQLFLNENLIGDEGATRLLGVMRDRERVLVSVCNNRRVKAGL